MYSPHVALRHTRASGLTGDALVLQATSKEQSIRIASSGGLSEEQIEKMVREAEANSAKDKSVSFPADSLLGL